LLAGSPLPPLGRNTREARNCRAGAPGRSSAISKRPCPARVSPLPSNVAEANDIRGYRPRSPCPLRVIDRSQQRADCAQMTRSRLHEIYPNHASPNAVSGYSHFILRVLLPRYVVDPQSILDPIWSCQIAPCSPSAIRRIRRPDSNGRVIHDAVRAPGAHSHVAMTVGIASWHRRLRESGAVLCATPKSMLGCRPRFPAGLTIS